MPSLKTGRRQVLAGGFATALALLVQACGGGSSKQSSSTGDAPGSTTGGSTSTAAASTSAAPATSGAPESTATSVAASTATVAELAASNPDLTVLAFAWPVFEQLGGDLTRGPVTVFAPSSAGFVTGMHLLDTTGRLPFDQTQGLAWGAYHMVDGAQTAEDLAKLGGTELKTRNGATLKVTVDGTTVKVNDATVTTADIRFKDGVIHLIDTVLLAPELPADASATSSPGGTSLGDVIGADSDLWLFHAFLSLLSLGELLSGQSSFTVFSPTNDAILDALRLLTQVSSTAVDGNQLSNVMLYHVVTDGVLKAADLAKMNGGSLNTLAGPPLTVAVTGATIKINDATVLKPDVVASNGVVHVIDRTLLPLG